MKVLVTNPFEGKSGFGGALVDALLEAGFQVGTLNREDPEVRLNAEPWSGFIGEVWTRSWSSGAMDQGLRHVDVVIHCSFVDLPKRQGVPEEAPSNMLDITRELMMACLRRPEPTRWVLVSSIAVAGPSQELPAPRRAADPVAPRSGYAKERLECEQLVVDAGIDCCVLRLAPMESPALELGKSASVRQFFEESLENRVELVHAKDAAQAVTRSISCEEARGQTLLIGGGKACQVRKRDVNRALCRSLGLPEFPDHQFGTQENEMDWLDTDESVKMLEYQTLSADDLFEEWEAQEAHRRSKIRWIRPLYQHLLLRNSRGK